MEAPINLNGNGTPVAIFFYIVCMKMYAASLLAIFLFIFGCTSDASNDIAAIKDVMDKQVVAWNNGDIEGYMTGYWNNDSLLFIGSKGPKYGYGNTLSGYKKSYPDKETMGQLSFSSLQYKKLSDEYYHVTGAWKLTRKEDAPSGFFTLIFRKIDGKWVIVADHSS